MGLFGIGVYAPVSYAPPDSVLQSDILTTQAGGVPGVNTLLYTFAEKKDKPKAFLMLNDASGTQAKDSSGNTANGTITGSVGYNVSGALSGPGESSIGGMSFGGSSYVALPSTFTPAGWSGLTLEIWANLPSVLSSNVRLVANAHTDVDNKGIQLFINASTRLITANLGTGSTQLALTCVSPALTNIWCYLALTWDGKTATLYFNGQPQASASFAGPISTTSFPINMGRNPAYNGDYLTGSLSLFSMYNRALSAVSIAQRYTNATAIGTTLYGGGFSTQPGQLLPPHSGIYGGQYGYIIYSNIRAPKLVQLAPAPSIGNDNLGRPVVRGFPQMTWTYSTLRPDYWYFIKQLYRLAGNAPPEYQYLVLIQYPDQSGHNNPIQQLARWDPPVHGYRTVGAFYGVQLKFTYVGQAELAAEIPLVTVI